MLQIKDVLSQVTDADHRINAEKILGFTIAVTYLILVVLFIAEITIDLKSSSVAVLLPFLALNTVMVIAYLLNFNTRILGICLIMLQFAIIETHALLLPGTFHAMVYWYAIIPTIALIVGGVRLAHVSLAVIVIAILFNAHTTKQLIGSTYPVTIHVTPFVVTGILFSVSIFSGVYLLYRLLADAYIELKEKSTALEKLQLATDQKKLKLEKYQAALFKLSKDVAVMEGNMTLLYEKLCQIAAENLDVTRVSIWSYEANPPSIHRKYLYEINGGTDEVVVLEKNHFPGYFRAMLAKNYIAAENARTHPETAEFKDSYLIPLDIYSMLDCPISMDGQFMGVVCCEHQKQPRHWSAEDILFVQSLSDIVALALKTFRIQQLLTQIRNQNHELIVKSTEIEGLNQELSSANEELSTMNESLEHTVKGRTEELEKQNVQLTEYAFINSHLLRAPLARILGLAHLISQNKDTIPDTDILNGLIQSTNELDAITRRISELLYAGRNFSREEVKEIIERNLNKKTTDL